MFLAGSLPFCERKRSRKQVLKQRRSHLSQGRVHRCNRRVVPRRDRPSTQQDGTQVSRTNEREREASRSALPEKIAPTVCRSRTSESSFGPSGTAAHGRRDPMKDALRRSDGRPAHAAQGKLDRVQ